MYVVLDAALARLRRRVAEPRSGLVAAEAE
jgi:hypothetical protein